jgi:hypothetical protein
MPTLTVPTLPSPNPNAKHSSTSTTRCDEPDEIQSIRKERAILVSADHRLDGLQTTTRVAGMGWRVSVIMLLSYSLLAWAIREIKLIVLTIVYLKHDLHDHFLHHLLV